jgi:DNA-binding CsgD family transcriptional regulator
VVEIGRSIADAATLGEVWRHARKYYRALGFRAVAYCLPRQPGISTSYDMDVIQHGFPPKVAEAYMEIGRGHADPVPRLAIEGGVPVRWSDMWAHIDPSPDQAHFLEVMRELEMGDGYSIPVFGPNGRDATVSVGRAVSKEALDTAPIERMHLLAQAAHTRVCVLSPDWHEHDNPLSAREMEILRWVARGKSNGVIADILSLSAGTVDTYLRRIYDKLDVSDRTSAAVRGVGMGLIAA